MTKKEAKSILTQSNVIVIELIIVVINLLNSFRETGLLLELKMRTRHTRSGTFRHQPFGRQYGVGHMGDKSVDQMGFSI